MHEEQQNLNGNGTRMLRIRRISADSQPFVFLRELSGSTAFSYVWSISLTIFLILAAGCWNNVPAAEQHPQAFGFEDAVLNYEVQMQETLPEIARRFNLGYNAIVSANPGVDPYMPSPGTMLAVPAAWILPDTSFFRGGILINLAELRLYYFPSERGGSVLSFPIGIGDMGRETPAGVFTIVEKISNPTWHVPESVRREKPHLPRTVPPGPDNPLGSHALRLSLPTILIHGTDKPWGIGRRSSAGCIRLYPEDIRRLFPLVGKGTRVTIVSQAVKAGVTADGAIFVEVHPFDQRNYLREAMILLEENGLLERVDLSRLMEALREKRGMPVDVTRALAPSVRAARRAVTEGTANRSAGTATGWASGINMYRKEFEHETP